MYKAILLPKLLYASVVWWSMVSRAEAKNLLQSLQDSNDRVAVGSTTTTPTEALEVTLCQFPLDLAATGAARLTTYRLKCQKHWRDTGLGSTKLDFLCKHPFTLHHNKTLKTYQLAKPHLKYGYQLDKISIINPNMTLWFTDRLGIHGCFGAGF
jgi:hypothetical protein